MEPLIDFHGHCGVQHNRRYAPEQISAFLADQPVERIVISPLSATFSRTLGETELLALAGDPKVLPIYWVNPYRSAWAADLERLHSELPMTGIKLHPTADIYEVETEFLRPVWEHCQRTHRFICVHTDTFKSAPGNFTELIVDFPDVDVVLVHMDDPIVSIYLAKCFANVFLETSWVERKWLNLAPVKIALDSVATEKILFGTDFPYEFPLPDHREAVGTPRSYADIAEHYHELLPTAVARRILYHNAKDFLARYEP
jgi:predicted TIM-barrel fold metal-dependent hydrolase